MPFPISFCIVLLLACMANLHWHQYMQHTFVMQYRERIIFLGKAIDEETGNQLVATMLYLDSENKKDLNLYINCSGGDVSDAELFGDV